MKTSRGKAIYWAPRALGMAMAAFLSIFAFDVFAEGHSLWRSLGAFLVHLAPTYAVVIALALAWRREWLGAVLFVGLGLFYAVWVWGRVHPAALLVTAGPLIVTGGLFLLCWVVKRGRT